MLCGHGLPFRKETIIGITRPYKTQDQVAENILHHISINGFIQNIDTILIAENIADVSSMPERYPSIFRRVISHIVNICIVPAVLCMQQCCLCRGNPHTAVRIRQIQNIMIRISISEQADDLIAMLAKALFHKGKPVILRHGVLLIHCQIDQRKFAKS